VDGIAGPRTLAAIRAFEQSIGLPVTGRVTQALIARMAFAL
jgi:peptidoglycan hydrolase-like protein with peptidoglycan-binding domain